MTQCQHCTAKTTGDLFLCAKCTKLLDTLLMKLPASYDDLEVTRTRQDRLITGGGSRADRSHISPINVKAMELSRGIEKLLIEWTDLLTRENGLRFFPSMSVGCNFVGPLLPGWKRLPRGYSGSPAQRSRWLAKHAGVIAGRKDAGELLAALIKLLGDPADEQDPGDIVLAVDRFPKTTAGPCPAVVGRDDEGNRLECGEGLWALDGEKMVICPKCGSGVDVAANRSKSQVDHDLVDEKTLLKALKAGNEKLPRSRLYKWLESGQLHAAGYLHGSDIVPEPVHRGSLRLFSLSRVRALNSQYEMQRAQRRLRKLAS